MLPAARAADQARSRRSAPHPCARRARSVAAVLEAMPEGMSADCAAAGVDASCLWATLVAISTLEKLEFCWLPSVEERLTIVDKASAWVEAQATAVWGEPGTARRPVEKHVLRGGGLAAVLGVAAWVEEEALGEEGTGMRMGGGGGGDSDQLSRLDELAHRAVHGGGGHRGAGVTRYGGMGDTTVGEGQLRAEEARK